MNIALRKTNIQGLQYIISSCPSKQEEITIAYDFIKKIFCKVCKRSLVFSNSKYDIIEYPFLFRERQLDSVVLPTLSDLCKGLVIAEYPITRESYMKDYEKNNSKGRIDYWCIYKDYSFVVEMKHSYDAFRSPKTSDARLIQRWETMNIGQLQDIRNDVRQFEEKTRGLLRIGLHFITPYSECERNIEDYKRFESEQKAILNRLYEHVSRKKPKITTPDFMASWILPKKDKYLDVPYKGTYPGLLLLGKIFPVLNHSGVSN